MCGDRKHSMVPSSHRHCRMPLRNQQGLTDISTGVAKIRIGMSIRVQDVDDLLSQALPEFAPAVREHRLEWGDEPMLYVLVGGLFNLLVDSSKMAQPPGELARRAYEVVEKAMTEGTPDVKDLFAIEMIEPFWGDPHHEFYPNFESLMGPASLAKLEAMR